MQIFDYRIVVHMQPNFHDNPEKPYFWCILKYDGGLSNSGAGWAIAPNQAFADGVNYLNNLLSKNNLKESDPTATIPCSPG